jgi:hypothetical protein
LPLPFSFREEGELLSGNHTPLPFSFREEGEFVGVGSTVSGDCFRVSNSPAVKGWRGAPG